MYKDKKAPRLRSAMPDNTYLLSRRSHPYFANPGEVLLVERRGEVRLFRKKGKERKARHAQVTYSIALRSGVSMLDKHSGRRM